MEPGRFIQDKLGNSQETAAKETLKLFGKIMLTRTSLIIVGFLSAFILVILNAYFHFAIPSRIPSFTLELPIGERDITLLVGVGLMGLRWFLVHRKQSDNDAT